MGMFNKYLILPSVSEGALALVTSLSNTWTSWLSLWQAEVQERENWVVLGTFQNYITLFDDLITTGYLAGRTM